MNLDDFLRDEVDIVRHDVGVVIFDRDDPGDAMYIVRRGQVDLLSEGVLLERVGAGGLFGEMALLDRAERSATAVVAAPATLVRISRARFQELVRSDPGFALHVMGVLADRLRRLTPTR